jgi:adenosylcobinamide-GDP ribazoletransferase
MLRGLVTALRTLTILPVPGRDAERFSDSLYWFLPVGLLVGGLEALLAKTGMLLGWPELSALLVLLGGIISTRGLHADGFADLADGFFGGRNREARLHIMKDPSVGSFGAIALVLVNLFKWVVLLELSRNKAFGMIVAGSMLARMSQVLLASSLPYARAEGGTATAFVDGAGRAHLIVAVVSGAALLLLLPGCDPERALLLMVAGLFSALVTGWLSYRKIGGVTGDVLGAGSEVTETLVWLTATLILKFSPFLM